MRVLRLPFFGRRLRSFFGLLSSRHPTGVNQVLGCFHRSIASPLNLQALGSAFNLYGCQWHTGNIQPTRQESNKKKKYIASRKRLLSTSVHTPESSIENKGYSPCDFETPIYIIFSRKSLCIDVGRVGGVVKYDTGSVCKAARFSPDERAGSPHYFRMPPKPAPKDADEILFRRATPALKRLHAKSRKELRDAARKEWKAQNERRAS